MLCSCRSWWLHKLSLLRFRCFHEGKCFIPFDFSFINCFKLFLNANNAIKILKSKFRCWLSRSTSRSYCSCQWQHETQQILIEQPTEKFVLSFLLCDLQYLNHAILQYQTVSKCCLTLLINSAKNNGRLLTISVLAVNTRKNENRAHGI